MADANYAIEGITYLAASVSARDMLRSAARRSPSKGALITPERRLTYADFDEATKRLGADKLAAERAEGR